jgi:hypothetical protein
MPTLSMRDAAEFSPSQARPGRRLIPIGLGVAAIAYLVSLIATIPATLAFKPPSTISLDGTIWNGTATLPGGYEAAWRANPIRSLFNLSFAIDWSLRGLDTDMTGKAGFGIRGITIDAVSGRAGSSLVKALAPGLPLLCDGAARLDLRHFRWRRSGFQADGSLRSGPASCPLNTGQATAPPLIATISDVNGALIARVATVEAPATILATASLDPAGRLTAELRPQAASVIPGLPQTSAGSGPYRLETTLAMP